MGLAGGRPYNVDNAFQREPQNRRVEIIIH